MSTANASLVTAPKVQTTTYEFTKRKRWTDTLFSETSEAIFLIVSPSFKILYCSSAVVEILGWKEDQLVDADLGSFIEQEDLENFMWAFTEVLRLGQSLFTYTRFKFEHPPSMTSVPSLLFEVKGRMHYFTGQPHARCVFLSAMPYPNRDITLYGTHLPSRMASPHHSSTSLNSFLGLKIENESLSRRIREMKLLIETSVHTPDSQSQTSRYTHGDDSPESILNSPSVYFGSKSKSSPYSSFIYPESSNSELSNCGADFLGSPSLLEDLSFGTDIDYDEIQRKKKKTIIGEEQRVCMKCGRTDSPEWRKGPHGPKTLCNACGLRWAKSTRKDEPEIGATLKVPSMPPSDNSSSSGLVNNKHMLF